MNGLKMHIQITQEGDTNTVYSVNCNFDFEIRIHHELLGEEFDIITSQFNSKIIFPNESLHKVILSTIETKPQLYTINNLNISVQINHLGSEYLIEHVFNEWFDNFVKILKLKNKSSFTHNIEIEYPFKISIDEIAVIKMSGNLLELVELKKSDIEFAISSINKEIRLQYSLMLNAHSFFGKNDYRNCILSCATIIEICLSDLVQNHLCSNNTGLDGNSDARDLVVKNCNGLIGLRIFLAKLGCDFVITQEMLRKKIGDIRNKAIHSGYMPTKEESETALELCEKVLEHHYADKYFIP